MTSRTNAPLPPVDLTALPDETMSGMAGSSPSSAFENLLRTFELLTRMPEMGRYQPELWRPPYRRS